MASLSHEDEDDDDQLNQEDNACALEADLFTLAFVTFLEIPSRPHTAPDGLSKGLSRAENVMKPLAATAPVAEKAWSVLSMCSVTLVQLLMVWVVYLHVKNDLMDSKTRPLLTAYEMLVGSNITIPLHTVETLCGEWEDQEMQYDIASGPLRSIHMPDGTVLSPNEDYSLFYNSKQPTRTWDYGRLGTERSVLDDVMFVISEGVSANPFTPSGYSLLFILMVAMLYFSVWKEIRTIGHFMLMLKKMKRVGANEPMHKRNKETKKIEIVGLSRNACMSGWCAILCRGAGTLGVLGLGTYFLLYTTLKIDLILNGLALLFILELDQAVYLATVPRLQQQTIENIEPIVFDHAQNKKTNWSDIALSSLILPFNVLLAVAVRALQCHIFQIYFKMTAAICLFAGPTPGGRDFRLSEMGPVAGFCDSLLGLTCAPQVEPPEMAKEHGYCVITDQTTMTRPTVQMYVDDENLFANRYAADGSEKSWVDWGAADSKLYDSGLWMDGPFQNILRKQCAQMYQKLPPDDLEVDDDSGETMDGAPFGCRRDLVFDAVFGPVVQASLHEQKTTTFAIMQVRSLSDPVVVSAVDKCRGVPVREAATTNHLLMPIMPNPSQKKQRHSSHHLRRQHHDKKPDAQQHHLGVHHKHKSAPHVVWHQGTRLSGEEPTN